jgi:hypothetical protein
MKWTTLQLHKETTMVCEEIMTHAKVQSALLVPLVNKTITTSKLHMEIGKINKNCMNYVRDNHNANTCRVKKKKSANYNNNKGY